ncbi:hypothetical protein, partial [Lysinibacillus sp. NPDC096215]|uniref:hypothetical protein n=2 Tax=unclassified Lysinibacillus TaxID=2636778 RepID=UPI003D04EDA9
LAYAVDEAAGPNGKIALKQEVQSLQQSFNNHVNDNVKHVTTPERAGWNKAVADIGDRNQLNTQNKANLVSAINEVFTSSVDKNIKIASAITDKGVPTSADATSDQMAANIRAIQTGKKQKSGYVTGVRLADGNDQITVTGLDFLPRMIFVRSPAVVQSAVSSVYIHKDEFFVSLPNHMSFYISGDGGTQFSGIVTITNDGFTIKTGNPFKGTSLEGQSVDYNWLAFS